MLQKSNILLNICVSSHVVANKINGESIQTIENYKHSKDFGNRQTNKLNSFSNTNSKIPNNIAKQY